LWSVYSWEEEIALRENILIVKINFVATHLKINGGNRAILMHANFLKARGHDVTVIALTRGMIRRFIKNLLYQKANWINDFQARVLWVPDFSEQNIPDGDIVIATSWPTANLVAALPENKCAKFYFIQHYEGLYHAKSGGVDEVDKTYRLPMKKIVISTWLRDIMKKEFNSDSELIVTPVDFKQFYFIKEARKEKPIRVIMLHHTYAWKGVDRGKAAFEKVKKEFPDIQLVLFGARQKKIDIECDEYFYNPKQEDMAKMYSSCHIFLCPSEYEGLGMPAMEAMACRCAVATFDTGGSRDYAIDGETAMVAKQGDTGELATKLKMLVADNNLREKIAENGYNFIRENFSWERAADKLENILKDSLKNA